MRSKDIKYHLTYPMYNHRPLTYAISHDETGKKNKEVRDDYDKCLDEWSTKNMVGN